MFIFTVNFLKLYFNVKKNKHNNLFIVCLDYYNNKIKLLRLFL